MRHYRKPSLSARRPERPAVFEEMLAAVKPVGITPRTPAVRGRACLPAGFTVRILRFDRRSPRADRIKFKMA